MPAFASLCCARGMRVCSEFGWRMQIIQRMNEKPEKETGTRAELKKQFAKVARNSKVASQRSTKVKI